MAKDFYEILGLKRDASADDIKKAYRTLSKELHPDKHKGDKAAEQKFKEVNEAYETLSNPQKRQSYDQFGSANMGGGGGGGQGFGGFDFSGFSQGNAADFSDLFEGFFGGRGGARRPQDERGADHEVELTIDFQDVVSGATREFYIKKLAKCDHCGGNGAEPKTEIITCPECSGTGQVTRTAQSFFGAIQQRTVCPRCHGSGKVPEKPCVKCSGEGRVSVTKTISVDIPAGIAEGQTLRVKGEGDAGRKGATSGDLYVHIHVKQDPRFEREGDDIHTEQILSVVDATLGTTIETQTVHGPVSLKIPEGTQPDQILRIKGKGVPVLNTSRLGDHYVHIKVTVPTRLSKQEKKLLEEWRALQK